MSRDLASHDVWEESLERSRRRRAEAAAARKSAGARSLLINREPRPERDPLRDQRAAGNFRPVHDPRPAREARPVHDPRPARDAGPVRDPRPEPIRPPLAVERPVAPDPYRDLGDPTSFDDSVWRSQRRREAAAAKPAIPVPSRKLALASLMAVTGGPVVGLAALDALSGGGGGGSGGGQSLDDVAGAAKRAAPGADTVASLMPAAPTHHKRVQAPPPLKAKAPVRKATVVVKNAKKSKDLVVRVKHRPGGAVMAVQSQVGAPVDGSFGTATEKKLQAWQKRHELKPDGVVGPETRAELGLPADGRTLKPKAKAKAKKRSSHRRSASKRPRKRSGKTGGGGIQSLQRALGLADDGSFGPGTERALKRWQKAHGLKPDGVAGPGTRAKLGIGNGRVLKRKGASHKKRARSHSNTGGGGGGGNVMARVISAANAIATKPYRYGGGHGSFTDTGYDCSGSVSYALHGGGLLDSPLDSSGFMSYGAAGPGKHITIYANPGHMFMMINGRRFDTSSNGPGGSRWSSEQRSGGGYTVRHPAGY